MVSRSGVATVSLPALLWFAICWQPSDGVRLQPPEPPEEEVLAKDMVESRDSLSLRVGILWRFMLVDANNDSVVTLEELGQGGLGQLPGPVGDRLLRSMLDACARTLGARNCTRAEMEATLKAWPAWQARREAIGLLTGAKKFENVEEESPEPVLCGPSAEPGFQEGRDAYCYMQGPKCWKGEPITAWGLRKVCATRSCLCEPTAMTKRFGKLGFAGALAVYSAQNFSDPSDAVLAPACGKSWKVEKVIGRLDFRDMSLLEKQLIKVAANWLTLDPFRKKSIAEAPLDETEVALFRGSDQQIVKGGRSTGKVCMISWQGTRSAGDWKTNFMVMEVPFQYAPTDIRAEFPKGIARAYESTREQIKMAWEKQCCSKSFRAEQTVISGHSHGGALAIMNAIDMVTNWQCLGKDLGAGDIKLVTVAPHKHMLDMEVIDKVFSCSDNARCLAGSVATLVTENDRVGDGRFKNNLGLPKLPGMPFQPSYVTMLPCAGMSFGVKFHSDSAWWCHAMFSYAAPIEDLLVDEAGWGSTCGGACGNMNRQLQCSQFVLATDRGCSSAQGQRLKAPTPCQSWDSAKEKCSCHYDSCMDLTPFGCWT